MRNAPVWRQIHTGAQVLRAACYGVVVLSVKVSVLLYEPVRRASVAPMSCANPIVTESLLTGPA